MQFKITLALALSTLAAAHYQQHDASGHAYNAGHESVEAVKDAGRAAGNAFGYSGHKIADAGRFVGDKAVNAGEATVDGARYAKDVAAEKARNAGHAIAEGAEATGEYVAESTPVQAGAAGVHKSKKAWWNIWGLFAKKAEKAAVYVAEKASSASASAEENAEWNEDRYEEHAEKVEDNVEHIKAKTNEVVEDVKTKAVHAKEQAAAKLRDASQSISEAAERTRAHANDALESNIDLNSANIVHGGVVYKYLNGTTVPLNETGISNAEVIANKALPLTGMSNSAAGLSIAAAAAVVALPLLF